MAKLSSEPPKPLGRNVLCFPLTWHNARLCDQSREWVLIAMPQVEKILVRVRQMPSFLADAQVGSACSGHNVMQHYDLHRVVQFGAFICVHVRVQVHEPVSCARAAPTGLPLLCCCPSAPAPAGRHCRV